MAGRSFVKVITSYPNKPPSRRFFSGSMKSITKFFQDRRKPVVSVLNLHGVIAPNMSNGPGFGGKRLNIDSTQKLIDRAFEPEKLEAVLLSINSPGGSPAQSELIVDYINAKAKDRNVQVTSFVEDYAASGGYWLACAGRKIFVTRCSVVGSIGVITASFGFPKFISTLGIERRVRTAGKKKSFMDPFMPEKEEDVQTLKIMLDDMHESFKEIVRESRGERLKASNEETLFSGEFWVGERAVQLGLADGVSTLDAYVRSTYGPDRVRLLRVRPLSPLQQLLSGGETGWRQVANMVHEEELVGRFRVR